MNEVAQAEADVEITELPEQLEGIADRLEELKQFHGIASRARVVDKKLKLFEIVKAAAAMTEAVQDMLVEASREIAQQAERNRDLLEANKNLHLARERAEDAEGRVGELEAQVKAVSAQASEANLRADDLTLRLKQERALTESQRETNLSLIRERNAYGRAYGVTVACLTSISNMGILAHLRGEPAKRARSAIWAAGEEETR